MVKLKLEFNRKVGLEVALSDRLFYEVLRVLDLDPLKGCPDPDTPLEEVKDWQIERALDHFKSRRDAAKALQVSEETIYRRVTKHEPLIKYPNRRARRNGELSFKFVSREEAEQELGIKL